MTLLKTGMLPVPGASLYYHVRGSGPLLLILQGGDGDAEGSNGIAEHLVDRYTVLTYDRRGLSRSKIDDPAEPARLEMHSDDAHRLLASLTSEPALVLGTSIGALIGLQLVASHSEQVHVLVSHEPPAPELLPEPERSRAVQAQEDMEAAFRQGGAAAVMRTAMADKLMNFDDREPDAVLPKPGPQRAANLAFFYTHDAPAVRHFRLDIGALKTAAPKTATRCSGREARLRLWLHDRRQRAQYTPLVLGLSTRRITSRRVRGASRCEPDNLREGRRALAGPTRGINESTDDFVEHAARFALGSCVRGRRRPPGRS